MAASTYINLLKEFNGQSSGVRYARDARQILALIPLNVRKTVLLAKLSGAARSHADSLPDEATETDILTLLETRFPDNPVRMQEVLNIKQFIGQSVSDYAKAFQEGVSRINSGGAAVITDEMAKCLFVEGLATKIRKSIALFVDDKNLAQLI